MQPTEHLGLYHYLLDRARRHAERPEVPDSHPVRVAVARFLIQAGAWIAPQAGVASGKRVVEPRTAAGLQR
jgi:hypothetical protein